MLVVWGGYIMKKLNLIIILLIIFLIVLSVGILFTSGILQQSDNMKTIALSSTCTLDVIESFTAHLKPIFEKIWIQEDEIKKLSKLRDTLLPKLMSGEIDVTEVNSYLE